MQPATQLEIRLAANDRSHLQILFAEIGGAFRAVPKKDTNSIDHVSSASRLAIAARARRNARARRTASNGLVETGISAARSFLDRDFLGNRSG
jgi:hypothetical protein